MPVRKRKRFVLFARPCASGNPAIRTVATSALCLDSRLRRNERDRSSRSSTPEWLPRDIVAGIMLAAIAIPGQLATARLAGMPPETGLYAFAAGSLVFAAFGANRFMSVAADSTIAPRQVLEVEMRSYHSDCIWQI